MTPTTTSLKRRGFGAGTRSARAPIVRTVTSTRTLLWASGVWRGGRPILSSKGGASGRRPGTLAVIPGLKRPL